MIKVLVTSVQQDLYFKVLRVNISISNNVREESYSYFYDFQEDPKPNAKFLNECVTNAKSEAAETFCDEFTVSGNQVDFTYCETLSSQQILANEEECQCPACETFDENPNIPEATIAAATKEIIAPQAESQVTYTLSIEEPAATPIASDKLPEEPVADVKKKVTRKKKETTAVSGDSNSSAEESKPVEAVVPAAVNVEIAVSHDKSRETDTTIPPGGEVEIAVSESLPVVETSNVTLYDRSNTDHKKELSDLLKSFHATWYTEVIADEKLRNATLNWSTTNSGVLSIYIDGKLSDNFIAAVKNFVKDTFKGK